MRGMGTPFWRLLIAGSTSSLADGISRVVLPLLAATLTRDPVLISGLTTLAFLPWLLFGLLSGAVVDRVDRRRAIAGANVVRAAAIGGLGAAVVLGTATIGLIYAVAFAVGIAETVHDSAARAALPQVVRPEQLETGNSMIAVQEVVGQSFLGAPVGAVLFAAAAAVPLFANAAGFLLAAALVLTIRRDLRPVRAEKTSMASDIRAGARWLFRHRLLRDLTLLTAVMAFGLYMTYAVMVLYVLDTLSLRSAAYGIIVAAGGAGAVLGGLSAPRIRGALGRGTSLAGSALLSGLATMTMGLVDTPLAAGTLFAVAALAGTVWDVLAMSLRQALVPEELFGRVQGSYRTLVWGVIPLGALTGGALAAATSVPTVFIAGGLINILASAALWQLVRRHRTQINTVLDAATAHP